MLHYEILDYIILYSITFYSILIYSIIFHSIPLYSIILYYIELSYIKWFFGESGAMIQVFGSRGQPPESGTGPKPGWASKASRRTPKSLGFRVLGFSDLGFRALRF